MRKIREVLRLKFEPDLSERQISKSTQVSRSTASGYLRRFVVSQSYARVLWDAFSRPDGQLHASVQIEKRDCAILKLRAENTLRRQTQPIPVKRERLFQIINAKGDNSDARFHISSPLSLSYAWQISLGVMACQATPMPRKAPGYRT